MDRMAERLVGGRNVGEVSNVIASYAGKGVVRCAR
jgi:hypothetical protein